MRRLSVRRSSTVQGDLLAAGFAFGLGFLGGAAFAALVGNLPSDRIRGTVRALGEDGDGREVIGRAGADRMVNALAGEPALTDLRVIMVRRDQVEIHGWVSDRKTGSHAVRLAGTAAPDIAITNRILVRGEDDLSSTAAETDPQPA